MNLNPENFVLVGAILLFCSVLAGKTGYKFGRQSESYPIHRCHSFEHHLVFGGYGHQIPRHKTHYRTGRNIGYTRCTADDFHHRTVYLLYLRSYSQYKPRYMGIDVVGSRHVFDRFGLGILDSPIKRIKSERTVTPHPRTRKR